MSKPISEIAQQKSISGLDTFTHTAASTRAYKLSIRAWVVPSSGLSIAIKQNSTTIRSATISSAQQQVLQLEGHINATAGDVMSFVLTSSNTNDSIPNNVKALARIEPID